MSVPPKLYPNLAISSTSGGQTSSGPHPSLPDLRECPGLSFFTNRTGRRSCRIYLRLCSLFNVCPPMQLFVLYTVLTNEFGAAPPLITVSTPQCAMLPRVAPLYPKQVEIFFNRFPLEVLRSPLPLSPFLLHVHLR